MKPRQRKRYDQMTADELAAATADLDKEMPGLPGRALTAEQKRLHREARRFPGRPRVGKGAKVVSISVEQGLLEEADAMARKLGITRAELVARALRASLIISTGARRKSA
jgi:hypothetical protein